MRQKKKDKKFPPSADLIALPHVHEEMSTLFLNSFITQRSIYTIILLE